MKVNKVIVVCTLNYNTGDNCMHASMYININEWSLMFGKKKTTLFLFRANKEYDVWIIIIGRSMTGSYN